MIKESKIIKHTLTRKDIKQFIKIPLDIPSDVEKMRIRYTYTGDNASSVPGENKSVIDFALLDEMGKEVGATGSSHKDITISPSYSTPGYASMEINEGTWTIVCGAYMLQSEELEVTYHIDFYKKHYRWLKGDMHLHTVNSDGKFTVSELADKARQTDYDFIIITDHNNFFHLKRLPYAPNLTIIPGVELSHYMGHMNFWGLEVPYTRPYCVNSFDEFKMLNEEAKKRGAIISLNHPLCNLCPWRWSLDDIHYDAIEVWNGPMRPDNLNTFRYWHQQLLKGKRLVAVGGSDYHRNRGPVRLWGKPTSYVYSRSNTKADLLKAIKEGRIAVAKDSLASFINMTSGDSVVGDTVKHTIDTSVTIAMSKLPRNHTIVVYNNDEIIYSYKSSSSKPFSATIIVPSKGFVRAEVLYRPTFFEKIMAMVILYVGKQDNITQKLPDYLYSFTNPIYFD